MENVLLFVLVFASVPFLLFLCFQLFTTLMDSIGAVDQSEVEEDKFKL